VKALGVRLDRPAVSARYLVSKDNTLSVVPGIAGIRLEQDKMKALMLDQLARPAAGVRELAAPSAADTNAFSTQQAQEWLPKLSRTSTFTTSFPVSASRHANIATGSSQFDGLVIMPGQTFSFWQLLGQVTVERGYAFAGAIIENRSDENVIGGGLCQVSTTIFNAVSKLGYDIVERHAHGYLIERYPIGLDAAVFDPGVDFKWRNDTSSPVFLWSWVADTSVTFDVWGLPTGRTVTFTDAVQRNFIDVPADQRADPAFPKGYAIRGRDVYRTRTVTEGNSVLHEDTFFSHYAPVWGGPAEAGTASTVR
jgi:vancomycin resistance protein YoaR